jgi:predicted HTH transcriptional regulator
VSRLYRRFIPGIAQRGGHQDRILKDICAMSNSNGGTIYIGVSAEPQEPPVGVRDIKRAVDRLYTAVSNRLSPEPDIHIDTMPSKGKQVVRVTVQPGSDAPYAIDDNQFYVRDEAETSLAVRDEIVQLVERSLRNETVEPISFPLPLPGQPVFNPGGETNVRRRQKTMSNRRGPESRWS